jgi:hypothetical protein
MANETTVAKVKTAIRISHTLLDDEISDQVDACLADLRLVGIADPNEEDALVLSAIKLWCKSENADDVAERESFRDAYDKQKACLMTASGYGLPSDEGVTA